MRQRAPGEPLDTAASSREWIEGVIGLMIAGALISLPGITTPKRARTPVNPLKRESAAPLTGSGVYSRTHNPMYLGYLLVTGGWAILVSQHRCPGSNTAGSLSVEQRHRDEEKWST